MSNVKPWFNHYPADIPETISYTHEPLHHFLIESAKRVPKKKALNFLGKEMTFEQLLTEAKKLANFLQSQGLKKGDRVASMLPNTPQAVIVYYGAMLAGGVVVQVNPLFTERELQYQMENSGAKFIVCLDILLPRVSAIKDETDLEHVIVTRIADYLPF